MLLLQIAYYLISVPALLYCFRKYKASPVTVFLFFQIIMFWGINGAPRAQTEAGQFLIHLYPIALISFLLGVAFRAFVRTKKDRLFIEQQRRAAAMPPNPMKVAETLAETQKREQWQKTAIKIMIAVSIAACVYFFAAAGANVFVQALKDFAAGENNDISADRREYFNVSGVGYVYQFRAILLPILTAYVVLTTQLKAAYKVILAVLMLVFLFGTGQRNAFAFFSLVVFLYWVYLPKEERKLPRAVLIGFAAICGVAMIVLTIANGYVSGGGNSFMGAIDSLVKRVLNVNQSSALLAFSYIKTQPIVWGYDWAMMLMDILPGKSGYLSVDRIAYYLAYGTYSGTGPPCLWGSAWYNFGYLGVTVFPFFMGYVYQSIYKWYQRKEKEPLLLLIYSALCVYLGIWFYGTPMTLFNNGVVTVALLYVVLYKIRVKTRSEYLKRRR